MHWKKMLLMEKVKPIVLNITNMEWLKTSEQHEKLPNEVQLQWANDKWDYEQVSSWLNSHFNASIKDLLIKQVEEDNAGGGWGGCC